MLRVIMHMRMRVAFYSLELRALIVLDVLGPTNTVLGGTIV